VLNSILLKFDMKKKLIDQCYASTSVITGHVNGLQAKVKEIVPNASGVLRNFQWGDLKIY
jgi:hypothetical protein